MARQIHPGTIAAFGELETSAQTRGPLIWLSLVCLDAPVVAIGWQWMFAHSFHLSVPIGHRIVLFLTAWIIYLGDRLADAVSLRKDEAKSLRQRFCLRHVNPWIGCVIGAAVIDVLFLFKGISRETIVPGIVVGGLTIGYLCVNHTHNEIWKWIPIKELMIGSLFAAGTLLSVTPHVFGKGSTTIVAAILFTVLCSLNCLNIAIWERNLDRVQGKHSIATHWGKVNILPLHTLLVLVTGCVVLAALDPTRWPLALSFAVSGLLLNTLGGARLSRDERTALADLVLLTPLVFFFAERLL